MLNLHPKLIALHVLHATNLDTSNTSRSRNRRRRQQSRRSMAGAILALGSAVVLLAIEAAARLAQ